MRLATRRVRFAPYSVFAIHAAVTIIFLTTGALHDRAQAQGSAREARLNKSIERRQRELMDLENSKERASKPSEEQRLLYEQLKQDFEQLQVMNNNLSTVVASGQKLNYEQIRNDVAEIRKRAARLKANLSLPELAKGEKPKKVNEEFNPESFKAALNALDSLIKSFVENPVFQHLDVINVGYSMKASRDLENIIMLSEQIHKSAEVLNKAGGKNL